jgi:medium-chain acyl-[acyl-carrier-protein] hydrolase
MRIHTKSVISYDYKFNSWLYIPKPIDQPAFRLFCFPYAGGTAEVFHQWIDLIPNYVELCAIQLPGRSLRMKEAPLRDMQVLVEELFYLLKQLQDVPFAFFGHSMGAQIAFEIASLFYQNHLLLPNHLFISARKALHLPSDNYPIHKMSNEECIALIKSLNIIPEEVLANKEMAKMIITTSQADFEMIEKRTYGSDIEPLPIPLWAFCGSKDFIVNRDSMVEWCKYTTKEFKLFDIPGEHLFIINADSRATVVNTINRALEADRGLTHTTIAK